MLLSFSLNYVRYFNKNIKGLRRQRISKEELITHFTDNTLITHLHFAFNELEIEFSQNKLVIRSIEIKKNRKMYFDFKKRHMKEVQNIASMEINKGY